MAAAHPASEISARHVNLISRFLAVRDIPSLTAEACERAFGRPRADLLILLGSGVLATAERAAEAYGRGLADRLMIAGGIGHSTVHLVNAVKASRKYAGIDAAGKPEAVILAEVARIHAGVDVREVVLEVESTNCGNNATFALRVLKERGLRPETILLMQDPTMQRRTGASFEKAWSDGQERARLVNYAAFVPEVEARDGALRLTAACEQEAAPLWEMERFLSLLSGEIPRLHDDENGYGPRGKGFIGHVDVPDEVLNAYRALLPLLGVHMRM
ncbi:YdcF family protein [Sorangium sp. So ce131]|uniref:YdcF family protein n=1 Tax=Sorangium sp. So ce131 TaxID=3133282 RepID=UPI003F605C0D